VITLTKTFSVKNRQGRFVEPRVVANGRLGVGLTFWSPGSAPRDVTVSLEYVAPKDGRTTRYEFVVNDPIEARVIRDQLDEFIQRRAGLKGD